MVQAGPSRFVRSVDYENDYENEEQFPGGWARALWDLAGPDLAIRYGA